MSKLIFTFDRDWIEEKKKQYGNPIRKMERVARDMQEVKLIKSDYDSFTVETEEDYRKEFVSIVFQYVRTNFEEAFPSQHIYVGGDTQNLNWKEEQAESEENTASDNSVQEQTEEEQEESSQEPRKQEAQSQEPRRQETVTEEKTEAADSVEAEASKPQTAEQETSPEEQQVQETAVGEDQAVQEYSYIDKLCTEVPMRYSRELANHLRELDTVIPMLKRMYAKDCVWSQNLLISIDNGFGFSSFLNAMLKVYQQYELAERGGQEYDIKELVIGRGSGQDELYADWKNAVSRAREYASANRNKSKRVILAMDISQWQSDLTSKEVVGYLRQINEYASSFICVFRLPLMEPQVVQRVSEMLSDVMAIKTLLVPPISLADMLDYLKGELHRCNCSITEECDEALEQWIIKEKSDDSFFGYKTLDKMVRQMIYAKALSNCKDGTADRNIRLTDVLEFLKSSNMAEDPYELLGNLVGIAQVKQRIREIIVQIKAQQEMTQQGKTLERPAIHMMFTGNPGTGKTTVARILARIMKQEGVLRKGLFYEIKGRDLCGRYVGETAPKTSAYCRDAYGSILFIDEAYGLYQRDIGRDYGKEAIQTLIAEMENHRDDFCVIMAGYQEEMKEMLEANLGLESRIPYVIEFPNYSREELQQIFFKMLDQKFEYEENLEETVREFFEAIPDEMLKDKSFSNARLVRNLFERAWGKAAYRRSLNGEDKIIIRREDLVSASNESEFRKLLEDNGRRKGSIGFSY